MSEGRCINRHYLSRVETDCNRCGTGTYQFQNSRQLVYETMNDENDGFNDIKKAFYNYFIR